MAYPTLRLDGQYTLQRVLTLPNNASTPLVKNQDEGKLVSFAADGSMVLAAANAKSFAAVKAVESDGFVSVDFTGVYKVTASGAIAAGSAVIPSGSNKVKAVTTENMVTHAVALTPAAADGDVISIFFLN